MAFDSKLAAQLVLEQWKQRDWSNVKLAIIQANDDLSSSAFIKQKLKACKTVGAQSEYIKLDASISQNQLLNKIHQLNQDPTVTGIILQLPIYEHLDQTLLLQAINPKKDVDGLTGNCPYPINSCVLEAILMLKQTFTIDFVNKQIVVVGLGVTGGGPIFDYLKTNGFCVKGCDKNTPNTFELVQQADIVITAIGKPHYFKAEQFKPGVILFDVGISRDVNNKFCGDIDPNGIEKKAKWWTPTPGGVGPFTVVAVMKNLWTLYENHQRGL